MDTKVAISDNKETDLTEERCSANCNGEHCWNPTANVIERSTQDVGSANDVLANCDVSSKKLSSNCLPIQLNGLIHNHLDQNHQETNHVNYSDVQSSNTSGVFHSQNSVSDIVENVCDNTCDSDSTVDHVDQEQVSPLADVSTLSVENLSLTHELDIKEGINYVVYRSEEQMPGIMRLITKDLSEPYSIYTYRYFIHNWPKLCFLAMHEDKCVGAIVCKLDLHKKVIRRGYIAMLAVDQEYRRKKIGSHLVLKAIRAMTDDECDEVVLETEITNKGALRLYENLGFVRDKRLFRYYLNGVDALRLKLWLS